MTSATICNSETVCNFVYLECHLSTPAGIILAVEIQKIFGKHDTSNSHIKIGFYLCIIAATLIGTEIGSL